MERSRRTPSGFPSGSMDCAPHKLPEGYSFRIEPSTPERQTIRMVLRLPSGEEQAIFEPPGTQPNPGQDPSLHPNSKPVPNLMVAAATVDGNTFAAITSSVSDSCLWLRWDMQAMRLLPIVEMLGRAWGENRFWLVNSRVVERKTMVGGKIDRFELGNLNQVYLENQPVGHFVHGDGWWESHHPPGGGIRRQTPSTGWPFLARNPPVPSRSKETWIVRPDTKPEALPPGAVLEPGSERPKERGPRNNAPDAINGRWWWIAGGLVALAIAAWTWKKVRSRS